MAMDTPEPPANFDYNMTAQQMQGMGQMATAGVMKELIDTDRIVMSIDYGLQGMAPVPTKDGGMVWKTATTPYLNAALRFKVMNCIRTRLNNITNFANTEYELQIENICFELHIELAKLLFMNPNGIFDNGSLESDKWARASIIHQDIMDTIWVGMTQAQQHGQRTLIERIGGFSETTVTPSQQKRRKILGLF